MPRPLTYPIRLHLHTTRDMLARIRALLQPGGTVQAWLRDAAEAEIHKQEDKDDDP